MCDTSKENPYIANDDNRRATEVLGFINDIPLLVLILIPKLIIQGRELFLKRQSLQKKA